MGQYHFSNYTFREDTQIIENKVQEQAVNSYIFSLVALRD